MEKLRRVLASATFVLVVVTCLSMTGVAQTATEGNIANLVGGGSAARWDISAANAGGTLTITFPDGRSARKTFAAGASPQISLGEKRFENLPDGVYVYELQLAPVLSAGMKDAAAKARGKDDDSESERNGRKPLSVSALTQSGSFAVVNGSIIVAGGSEPEQKRPVKASTAPTRVPVSPSVAERIRNNHRAFFKPDFVIADDLVVQGSACVGLDCVDGEVFGFDTIRMKENNTRLQYDDTSTTAGFATNNWQIRANSSASGGASFLAFVDQGATGNSETGTLVFQVDAGAPANSLRVSSLGRIGVRTATPVLDIHINATDTPDFRLEQNNTGGFAAQTWDIAGNEANFFVRDVTSGSRLPFRIRPGAPTSSIDIAANGNVGIGTGTPANRLDVVVAGGVSATAIKADTNQISQLVFSHGTTDQWFISSRGTADAPNNRLAVFFNTGAGFSERMTINSAGNVGINTNAPDQRFSVNGDASKTGGNTWLAFSDERLKTIKGRFNTGLKAVMQLQPIRYEYLKDNALGLQSEGEHIGFGAQTLQKVIPEAVTKNGDGYLMVNSDPIIWTMLNAIKEQQQEIAELKAEVQKLKTNARRHSNRRR